jgi:hypothetical protein
MPNENSTFAEVTRKSKEKRAAADTKTAARKAAELKADVAVLAARTAREPGAPQK